MQMGIEATLLVLFVLAFVIMIIGSFLYLVLYRQYRRGIESNKRWEEKQAKKLEQKRRKAKKEKRK
jgi:membrane protein implicated in regulation of membrane protease activity